MHDHSPVTPEVMASLAAVAKLPIGRDRERALVPSLAVLVDAANALSARMAAGERGIVPMLRFPGR